MLRLTILREILRYVPRFRDKVFVIAMDGAVVEDDNFGNLLLDIALLRSLRIGVALVHGAGQQVRRLALETGSTPSNIDGTGVTDAATLQLALTAANRVTHEILEGLAANDLRGAYSNALATRFNGFHPETMVTVHFIEQAPAAPGSAAPRHASTSSGSPAGGPMTPVMCSVNWSPSGSRSVNQRRSV